MNPIQQAIEQATAARDWLPTICGELSGLDVPEDDANMRAAIAGLERVEGKIDAALTSLRSLNKEVEEAVVSVCRAVAELPDRNSPADWPEAMLVTHDELADAVRTAVAAALGRGAGQAEWRSTLQTAADALLEIIIAGQDAKRDLDVNIPKGDPVHPVSGKLTWPLSTAMLARNKALALLESTPEASQPEKSCGQCRHRHQDGRLGCARENCHGRIDWEPATQPTQAEAPSEREALQLAWDKCKAACDPSDWTVSESAAYRGFFAHGYRAALATQQAVQGEPVHPNHRSDLRYVLATLNDCNANLKMKAELRERVQASIVGMRYVISRTEADPVQPEKEERRPLTEPELRHVLDGTNNMVRNAMRGPFWPELEEACRAIEAAHGITATSGKEGGNG